MVPGSTRSRPHGDHLVLLSATPCCRSPNSRGNLINFPGSPGEEAAQNERLSPPSTGIIAPVTYDEAGERTKAATLPNSSGSP